MPEARERSLGEPPLSVDQLKAILAFATRMMEDQSTIKSFLEMGLPYLKSHAGHMTDEQLANVGWALDELARLKREREQNPESPVDDNPWRVFKRLAQEAPTPAQADELLEAGRRAIMRYPDQQRNIQRITTRLTDDVGSGLSQATMRQCLGLIEQVAHQPSLDGVNEDPQQVRSNG